MAISYKSVGEFLKIDCFLTFKNSLLLAVVYLLLIPVIRGISNLDVMHSAQCLGRSVALIGAIIIVPITKQELETSIREIIYTKAWSYMKSVAIRLMCSFLIITFLVTTFALVMRSNNCIFPFWKFVFVTILYTVFLGLLGLVLSQAGNNVTIGYLSALGYWSFCQLQIIYEGNMFYLFPVTNGNVEIQKLVNLFLVVIFLLGTFVFIIKHLNQKI